MQSETGKERSKRGRVLRMKTGYNPNSSSVGSQIPTFFAMAAGAGTLTVLALHLLGPLGKLIRRGKAAAQLEERDKEGEGEPQK